MPLNYKNAAHVQSLSYLDSAKLFVLKLGFGFMQTPEGVYRLLTKANPALHSADIHEALNANYDNLWAQRAIVMGYIDGVDRATSVPEDSLLISTLGVAAKRLDRVSGL